jgi:hypothetical protein
MDELSLDWETSDKGVFGELNMVGYEFEKLYGMTRQ